MDIKFHGGDQDSGNVFVVETFIDAGCMIAAHKHAHSHLSVLVSGTAHVCVDGVTERITGYKMVTIPANVVHYVLAETDVVWLCLWADDLANKEQAYDSLKLLDAFRKEHKST